MREIVMLFEVFKGRNCLRKSIKVSERITYTKISTDYIVFLCYIYNVICKRFRKDNYAYR